MEGPTSIPEFFKVNFLSNLRGKFTIIVLLLCSSFVLVYQNFGQAIACSADGNISESFLNEFCWVHSTYTVVKRDSTYKIAYYGFANEVAEKGVRPMTTDIDTDDKLHYNTYYQWVGLVWLIQAFLFYLPHHIWKRIEGGRFNTNRLNKELSRSKSLFILNNFNPNSWCNDVYCKGFIICKVLGLVNVISQIWIINHFLGNQFTTYGWQIFGLTGMKPYERIDPFSEFFPTVTSCEVNRLSQTGKLTNYDALCVLPINIANEKIYTFLWFWFVAVALLSVCEIGLWLMFYKRSVRIHQMKSSVVGATAELYAAIDFIGNNLKYSDWFLLFQIERNVDRTTYLEVIKGLASNYNNFLRRRV